MNGWINPPWSVSQWGARRASTAFSRWAYTWTQVVATLEKVAHCSKLEASIILLLHKIPCILHGENRVGLKLLTMLLREGFSNVQRGFLFGHIRAEKQRLEAYAKEIERIWIMLFLETRMDWPSGVFHMMMTRKVLVLSVWITTVSKKSYLTLKYWFVSL